MLGLERFTSSQCRTCQQTGIRIPATLEHIKCSVIRSKWRVSAWKLSSTVMEVITVKGNLEIHRGEETSILGLN